MIWHLEVVEVSYVICYEETYRGYMALLREMQRVHKSLDAEFEQENIEAPVYSPR